jgi:hypothetical protein
MTKQLAELTQDEIEIRNSLDKHKEFWNFATAYYGHRIIPGRGGITYDQTYEDVSRAVSFWPNLNFRSQKTGTIDVRLNNLKNPPVHPKMTYEINYTYDGENERTTLIFYVFTRSNGIIPEALTNAFYGIYGERKERRNQDKFTIKFAGAEISLAESEQEIKKAISAIEKSIRQVDESLANGKLKELYEAEKQAEAERERALGQAHERYRTTVDGLIAKLKQGEIK